MLKSYLFLAMAIVINVSGQMILKYGVNRHIAACGSLNLLDVVLEKYVIVGFLLYAISAICWILALTKINLSVAYPTLALGYVLVFFLSNIFLNETIYKHNIVGVILIILGVILIHYKGK